MKLRAAFTICAKNYLAQALTLKNSFKNTNPKIDFFIFLSDLADVDELSSLDLILLDQNWIPEWKSMAFKYNVIEFSTSIKPFCFNKLFKEDYEKVIYLDPDIYVTSNLNYIYNYLDTKSIVLTPHYNHIQEEYSGSVPEEELLFVGIYNLGFCAIKCDDIGRKIINWWKNRLTTYCYADKWDGLHVDQKFMDFIPGFFPNDIKITHHAGINPAIWNLHERMLEIGTNKIYLIRDNISNELFPLLFFHFSGFDPFNPTLVNRRHPKYNTQNFPSFNPLFKEYVDNEYRNGYDYYSKLAYSFNCYFNREIILPIHRRLYRKLEYEKIDDNPFDPNGLFYMLLKENKLLSGVKTNNFSSYSDIERKRKGSFEKVVILALKILKRLIGIKYYSSFLIFIHDYSRFERQTILLRHGIKK